MIRKTLLYLLTFTLLFAAWEYACLSFPSLKFMLPSPSQIIQTLWQNRTGLAWHTLATSREMAGGFALALVFSFPLAWMMAYFGPLRNMLQPIFVAIQCLPMFALAPIMILWFGWSYMAIIVPTALMVFFPLTINIYKGLCATPKNMLDFFRLYHATAWQTFLKLQLPWALPHIFAGFRIAVALAGMGAVAGEWAGAQKGLGILMLESRRSADLPMMFAAMACVTALSLGFYSCILGLENALFKRKKTPRPFSLGLSAVLILCCFTGCQQTPNENPKTTLLLDWLPNPDHVPLYFGASRGFFMEEGIDLNILKVADPSDSIPFLTSGQADLCVTYMPHTIQALSRQAPVVPIGILIETPLNALIFRQGERIETPRDLNGKIFGYSVDGFHTKFLEAMLGGQKILPKALQNASFDLVGMLATGHVDVIYGAYWNIECENLRSHGIQTNYFPLSDFGVPTYYELLIVAKQNSRQSSPEFVLAFQKALQKSIDFSKNNPEEAFTAYLQANPDKSDSTKHWEKESWKKTIPTLASQQQLNPSIWNGFLDWLVTKDLLDSAVHQSLRLN